MTTSQSRNLRKAGAVALSLALAMSTLAITPASAAKKVKLAKTKITVNVGKTKTVKIKNVKKKQVKKLTVKSSKAAVAKAKASKKTAIKVTGKKAGSAKVTANLKLKKKVGGKKAYKLTLKVTVKKAAPAPVEPTAAPTAAPTPVVSGASISLDKPAGYTCSVSGEAVTITAKLLPATSNETVKFAIVDPTIASVSGTAVAAVNGVATTQLTGLKPGKTKVTATISAGSVAADVTVEAQKIAVKITDVKLTKVNEVTLFFDKDCKTDNQGFNKDKFSVDAVNTAGTRALHPNKITEAKDGMSAALTLDTSFQKKDQVTVTYQKGTDFESSKQFVAEFGDPADVNLITTKVEANVETKLEWALIDPNGIDVTAAQSSLDSKVTISSTDSEISGGNLSPATKATIKMSNVGKSAKVTMKYEAKPGDATGVTVTKEFSIECVEPQPVLGTGHFQKYKNIKTWGTDDATGTAKFYKPADDVTAVSVPVAGDQKVSFYAATAEGDAVAYDKYDVTSSNGDIVSAVVNEGEDGGKYANFTVSGVSKGTATINVTATKNTKPAYYSIKVDVTDTGKLTGLTLSAGDRAKVSNAFDGTYQAENKLTAKATDSLGNDVSGDTTFTYELTKPENPEAREIDGVTVGTGFTVVAGGAVGNKTTTFNAAGAKKGTYTVKVKAEYKGEVKETSTNITVSDVPEAAYRVDGDGAKMSYDVVYTKSLEIKGSSTADGAWGTARLAAYSSNVFVGYVDEKGQIGEKIGTHFGALSTGSAKFATSAYAKATAATMITGSGTQYVWVGISNGVKWATGNTYAPLYDKDKNFKGGAFATGSTFAVDTNLKAGGNEKRVFKYNAFSTAGFTNKDLGFENDYVFWANQEIDPVCAESNHKYTLRYEYYVGTQAAKDKKKTEVYIEVKNSLFKPTVTIEKRTVESIDADAFIDAMKTNVDLNCNTSNNWSIKGVYGGFNTSTKTHKPLSLDGSTSSISYVGVVEDGVIIMMPCAAEFKLES